jgi:hypothetical protein
VDRSFDASILKEAAEEFNGPSFNYQGWVDNENNVMWLDGDDVGIATFEYPGVYTVHWFFVSRGRKALTVAKAMIAKMFDDHEAQVLRGLTPVDLKAARWLAKKVGLTSYGVLEFPNGPHEIMMITKQDYLNQKEIN